MYSPLPMTTTRCIAAPLSMSVSRASIFSKWRCPRTATNGIRSWKGLTRGTIEESLVIVLRDPAKRSLILQRSGFHLLKWLLLEVVLEIGFNFGHSLRHRFIPWAAVPRHSGQCRGQNEDLDQANQSVVHERDEACLKQVQVEQHDEADNPNGKRNKNPDEEGSG